MNDETTLITETAPAPAMLPGPSASRARLAPAQKLTRAHLAIASRASVRARLSEATARVTQTVGAQLKTSLACRAAVLPSTIHPFTHLAARALFVTLEFNGEAVGILELDLLAAGAVLGRITGGQEPVGIPSRLSHIEEAALGWVLLSTLAELRKEPAFEQLSPRLVSLTLDRGEVLHQVDARLRHVALQLDLEVGETRCLARLLLPSLWLQSKFDALPAEASPEVLAEVSSATLPGTLPHRQRGPAPARASPRSTCGDVVLFSGVAQRGLGAHRQRPARRAVLRAARHLHRSRLHPHPRLRAPHPGVRHVAGSTPPSPSKSRSSSPGCACRCTSWARCDPAACCRCTSTRRSR